MCEAHTASVNRLNKAEQWDERTLSGQFLNNDLCPHKCKNDVKRNCDVRDVA
jgi:hypothetical protein